MIEVIEETVEKEGISKPICIGHFLLSGFSKKPKEFVIVYELIIKLFVEKQVSSNDIEEGIIVTLANFYDTLIDNPNSSNQLKNMVELFEKKQMVNPDYIQAVNSHVEALKKELEEEYMA